MAAGAKRGAEPPGPGEEDARLAEGVVTAPRQGPPQPRAYPDIVDSTLDDSFPASDPPSWAGR